MTSGKHVSALQQRESTQQRDTRMAWWRTARFGMFIHWGLYAEPAGVWNGRDVPGIGEWIMANARVPVTSYKKLAATFDPTRFDADAWVRIAKEAGMKYLVITAKHHDGFALFKSAASPFNIHSATPFRADPLRQLAAASKKYGVKLGFYYSQDQDWTAPGGAALPGGHWDKAQDGSFARYLEEKAIPQLKELLANYRPFPAVLWFDTPTKDMTPELAGKIVAILNRHPHLIWNNRLGGGYRGDFGTPEQHIPDRDSGEDWETCMTINDTWGFKVHDHNFKSTTTLLRNLIDIASKGGNYLLNVGPDASGTIPPPEVERLLAIGRWLKVNGEAIYGTGPTPFGAELGRYHPTMKDGRGRPVFVPSWAWRCTTKSGRLFLIFFRRPRTFTLPPFKGRVERAYLLADPAHPVAFREQDGRATLTLPPSPPDRVASVVVLETTS